MRLNLIKIGNFFQYIFYNVIFFNRILLNDIKYNILYLIN